jgi:hypothetical protein
MAVIEFLSENKLRNFIDPEAYKVIDYFLRKTAFSQPEADDVSKNNDIQITKEFLEQWIAQACGLKSVGAGNYPIDNYKDNDFGIDVKFISTKVDKDGNFTNATTNETSLGQNFRGFGKTLDQSFENKQYQEIVDGWKNILIKKLNHPLTDLDLKKIYYFIFIRGGNKIHLAIAKLNIDQLENISVKHATQESVVVDKYIENEFGKVSIYKAKKRMELRLYAKKLQEEKMLITWDFKDLYPSFVSIRDIIKNGKLKTHLKTEFDRFFKN